MDFLREEAGLDREAAAAPGSRAREEAGLEQQKSGKKQGLIERLLRHPAAVRAQAATAAGPATTAVAGSRTIAAAAAAAGAAAAICPLT